MRKSPKLTISRFLSFAAAVALHLANTGTASAANQCAILFGGRASALPLETYLNDPKILKRFRDPSFDAAFAARASSPIKMTTETVDGTIKKVFVLRKIGDFQWSPLVETPDGERPLTSHELVSLKIRNGSEQMFRTGMLMGTSQHNSSLVPDIYFVERGVGSRLEKISAEDVLSAALVALEPGHAVESVLGSRGKVDLRTADWASEHRLLRYRLAHGDETIKRMHFNAEQVSAVGEAVHKDSMETWGIFKIETPSGTKAIKFILGQPTQINTATKNPALEQAIFQMHLAELGVAPGVDGVLEADGVQKLLLKYPALRQGARPGAPDPGWAIVMDYVPEGWNPKPEANRSDRVKQAPWFARSWNIEKVSQRVLTVNRVLDLLGILDSDRQFLFTRDGRPLDFDLAYANVRLDARFRAVAGPAIKVDGRSLWDQRGLSPAVGFTEGNPFFAQATLRKFGTLDLQWIALKTLIDSACVSAELRAVASEKIAYFKAPAEIEDLLGALASVPEAARVRFSKELVLATFVDANVDGHLRYLLESR